MVVDFPLIAAILKAGTVALVIALALIAWGRS